MPPAFTRGVARVAHTGAGGSPSSAFVSQKGAKNKNSNHRKIILFDALVPGIRTPPVPALAQGRPPHKCGGQGVYPLAYQNSPTNSQFIFLLRKGGNYFSIIYLTTYHGNPANSATRNCPSEKSGKLPLSARKSTVRFLFDGSKSAARKKSGDFQKLSLTFPKDWV